MYYQCFAQIEKCYCTKLGVGACAWSDTKWLVTQLPICDNAGGDHHRHHHKAWTEKKRQINVSNWIKPEQWISYHLDFNTAPFPHTAFPGTHFQHNISQFHRDYLHTKFPQKRCFGANQGVSLQCTTINFDLIQCNSIFQSTALQRLYFVLDNFYSGVVLPAEEFNSF